MPGCANDTPFFVKQILVEKAAEELFNNTDNNLELLGVSFLFS
jgi:hypothetical protein